MRKLLLLVLLAAAGWLAGFLNYIHELPDVPPTKLRHTDAIVVLTGGPSRLSEAVALLAGGHGERLLISGVNARTNDPELIRSLGLNRRRDVDLFACCIDIGRQALDTVGNAQEIAEWAARHEYRSLRVVTADFHMKRSLLEIRRYTRDLVLVPHPVFSDYVRPATWWRHAPSARILFAEYNKLLVVWAKANLYDRIAGAPTA